MIDIVISDMTELRNIVNNMEDEFILTIDFSKSEVADE